MTGGADWRVGRERVEAEDLGSILNTPGKRSGSWAERAPAEYDRDRIVVSVPVGYPAAMLARRSRRRLPAGTPQATVARRISRDRKGLTPDSMRRLLLSSGPVLAGFTLPSITLLLTSDPKNLPALHEYALWAFILATGLLLLSVHTGALARDDSRKTIWFAGGFYGAGILTLLSALGFLFWPGSREHSLLRVLLAALLALITVIGTAAVAIREYQHQLRTWWRSRRL